MKILYASLFSRVVEMKQENGRTDRHDLSIMIPLYARYQNAHTSRTYCLRVLLEILQRYYRDK
jgi:hypothetical protein